MTDTDTELEEIRRQKLEQLKETGEHKTEATSESEDAQTTPNEPVYLENTDGFQSFLGDHDTVLVDFFADWCGPCKQLDPVVTSVAGSSDAAVLKVDIDANPELASAQNVRGVPTLVLFSDGQPVERLVGFQNERRLQSVIEQHS